MRAIDVHTHAFPDTLAPRAIAALEAECPWKAVAGGTVAELLESMDAAGVDASVVCSIATKPDQAGPILEWSRKIRCERIHPLPSVHPDTENPAEWIARFADEGFTGIKLHPMYQQFAADEPRADAVYDACVRNGLWITSHCGRDIAYPPDDDRAAPERFARIIERHPDLKLVCTHLGGWRMWDEVAETLIGRDVLLETSFSLDQMPPEQATDLIRRHGVGRVLFGTDWPWADQKRTLEEFARLDLTDDERRRVLGDNAAALLGV